MNYKDIQQALAKYNRKADKNLGQNFLVNQVYADMIASLVKSREGDTILEIGSGLGSLSEYLVQGPQRVILLDYDRDMIAYLTERFSGKENVTISYDDILKFDLTPYNKIIGNLPYYITTPIIKRVLLEASNLQLFVFMIQKEVALKLLSKENTKNYSPLHVLIAYLGKIQHIKDLKPSNFYPEPHIDSSVLTITINPDVDHLFAKSLFSGVNMLFRFNRKTLRNNLKGHILEKELTAIFTEKGVSLDLRPQQIPPQVYIECLKRIFHKRNSK